MIEQHFCQCGCRQEISWKDFYKYYGWPKYLYKHHYLKGIKLKDKITPFIEVECKCGCGEKFIKRTRYNKKYIFGHYARVQVQKGKSKEEFYGKEKALQMIKSSRETQLGITWEKRYGKSYSEQRKEIFIKNMIKKGRPGKNEKLIIDSIEDKDNIKLERQYYVGGYFVDGYCKETNTVYEIDEWHHNRRKERIYDKKRDNIIKNILNCNIIHIDECKYLDDLNNKNLIMVLNNV